LKKLDELFYNVSYINYTSLSISISIVSSNAINWSITPNEPVPSFAYLVNQLTNEVSNVVSSFVISSVDSFVIYVFSVSISVCIFVESFAIAVLTSAYIFEKSLL